MKLQRAFTLLEVLIATTLMMMLMGVMATVWQNAYRIAERTRSLLNAHQRAREALDQAEVTLLERSGTMPLIAQESQQSRRYPFKLGAYQSRVHMDATDMSVTDQEHAEGGSDLNGNGRTNDTFSKLWTDNPPGVGPKDPYAPGQRIKDAVIGNWGWSWGMGRRVVWHSDIVRFDTNRLVIDASKTVPNWQYGQVDYSKDVNYIDNVTDGLVHWAYLGLTTRRYQRNTITGLTNENTSGPYRGTTINPWVHKDASGTQRPTPWLGRSHVFRVVSGPAGFMEPNAKGTWSPQRTGDHGQTSAVPALPNGQTFSSDKPLEPDWGFVTSGSWNPNATDPAVGTPLPVYGSVITDNGGVAWRCEAPNLMSWDVTLPQSSLRYRGMVSGAYLNDGNGTWNTTCAFRTVQLRNVLAVHTSWADIAGLFGGWAFNTDYDQLASAVGVTNVSRYTIRTARMLTDWPDLSAPGSAAARAAARGRFGSLTLAGWWDGSGNKDPNPNKGGSWTGLAIGFPGAAPSSDEAPSHPAWASVDVGVVGGLERSNGSGFELVFTTALQLR